MGWQIPICQKERSPLQSFKKSMPDGIAESEFGNPFSSAESEFGIGLANSDLPKRTQSFTVL